VRFITPIYHCNVSSTGRLCLDELHGNWSPSLSIPKILETIRNLLITPNVANALVSWIADLTIAHTKTAGVDTRYADAATAHTATHAGEGVNTIVTRWSAAAPAAP
jgi:ubiquitin-protein ligase